MQMREQLQADPRDSQKGKMYAAERSLGWWEQPEDFLRFKDLARFVRRLPNSKRFQKMFPEFKHYGEFKLIERHHGGGACADANELVFRPGSWRRWLVIHEFAHTVHKREMKRGARIGEVKDPRFRNDISGYTQGHGWRYAQIYLKLILWFLGRAEHDRLKAAFKAGRVRYKTPRKMSPEQRAAAAIRLAKIRPNANYFRLAA